jgi:hypothetical protein
MGNFGYITFRYLLTTNSHNYNNKHNPTTIIVLFQFKEDASSINLFAIIKRDFEIRLI